MARKSALDAQAIEEIISRYKTGGAGGTILALSRHYGVNRVTIRYHLTKQGILVAPKVAAKPTLVNARGLNEGKDYLEYIADACRRGDKTIQAMVPGGRYVPRGGRIVRIVPDEKAA